jgi:hypothetical protein
MLILYTDTVHSYCMLILYTDTMHSFWTHTVPLMYSHPTLFHTPSGTSSRLSTCPITHLTS